MKSYSAFRQILLKGVAVTLLSVAILPAQARPDAEQDKPTFSDVPPTHWAYNAVQRLARAGIIEGYPLSTEQHPSSTAHTNAKDAVAAPLVRTGINNALDGSLINVDTTSTSVTLSGTVRSQAQKVLAAQIVRQKAPHFKIVNRLKIVGPAKH